ncbi:hypothetical protein M422DRAFT_53356 [Sphaerobolus stellatus SS14]|uniref:BTB domain-containing protein n=1 Tax=Sphaerobolus stellatus (strain SS14) TaxID=990650 RepID=A0A0C9V1K4_SPHS4|nr:hypothetical protein M422DRAFT_53356 [Sphaerobolus stellatus SS14]
MFAICLLSFQSPFIFDDADLIICCQTTGFRVHAGVITRVSDTLGSALELCTPGVNDFYDGLPVMPFYDDDPETVNRMLLLIYKGIDYLVPSFMDTNRHRSMQLLQLVTKYELTAIREIMLKRLRVTYPTTFLDFTIFGEATRQAKAPLCYALQLAADCDVPEILPMAWYDATYKPRSQDQFSIFCEAGKKRMNLFIATWIRNRIYATCDNKGYCEVSSCYLPEFELETDHVVNITVVQTARMPLLAIRSTGIIQSTSGIPGDRVLVRALY